jgi:hypothetical protein
MTYRRMSHVRCWVRGDLPYSVCTHRHIVSTQTRAPTVLWAAFPSVKGDLDEETDPHLDSGQLSPTRKGW